MAVPAVRTWEKVLYKEQGVPDNYVSEHFLSELQKNLYTRNYDLYSLIVQAGSIYEQLCCIATFVAIYFYLLNEWITPLVLIGLLMFSLSLIGGLFCAITLLWGKPLQIAFRIRTGLVIFIFSLILAPILHSLLATVSTDSIYALTIMLLVINWAFMDYTTPVEGFIHEPGSNTTALSSSLLAALCLASRLRTPYHTFALILVWASIFALWPNVNSAIRARTSQRGRLGQTVLSALAANLFVWPITYTEASIEYIWLTGVAVLVFTACINFLMPWLLVRMQRIKRTIHGPWDEAVLQM